jgi:putative SOS response-associated peptidase YedK
MCGRFSLLTKAEELGRALGTNPPTISQRHFKAGDKIPALTISRRSRRWDYPIWGIPLWDGKLCYNARSETISERALFRDAWMRKQRVIIPASEIVEFGRGGKPYCVAPQKRPGFFCLGGLMLPNKTAVVLTTAANQQLASIHHRQPLLIPLEKVDLWLDPSVSGEQILSLVLPYQREAKFHIMETIV